MFLTFKLGKQFYLFPNLCISNFRWKLTFEYEN